MHVSHPIPIQEQAFPLAIHQTGKPSKQLSYHIQTRHGKINIGNTNLP